MNPGGAGYGGHDREGPAGIVACRFTGGTAVQYLQLEDNDGTPITDLYGGEFLPTDSSHDTAPIIVAFTNVLPAAGWGEADLIANGCGFTQIVGGTAANVNIGAVPFWLPWNRSNLGQGELSADVSIADVPAPFGALTQQFTYLVFYSTVSITGYINLYRRSGPSLFAVDWIGNAP